MPELHIEKYMEPKPIEYVNLLEPQPQVPPNCGKMKPEDNPFSTLSNAHGSYRAYVEYLDNAPEDGLGTAETNRLAIQFLSDICDYYLNSADGDFVEIKMSDRFQR